MLEVYRESQEDDFDTERDFHITKNFSICSEENDNEDWSMDSSGEDFLEDKPVSNEWMDKTRELLILGTLYLNGCKSKKIEKDENKALELFLKAHELGHPRGSYKVGEILLQTNSLEAEKYFFVSIVSLVEKINEEDELYFGDADFSFMFNDFRNGVLKYQIFYEIVSQHVKSCDDLQKLKEFADSRRVK